MQKYWIRFKKETTVQQFEQIYLKPEILMAGIFTIAAFILIKLMLI